MAEHNEKGQQGEHAAVRYLESQGYTVLETNWRFGSLEADIIASTGDTLMVAEVKTRSSTYFGEPEVFVNRKKQSNLVKAAHAYILRHNLSLEVRFDILAVVLNGSGTAVKHIEGAFYPLLK